MARKRRSVRELSTSEIIVKIMERYDNLRLGKYKKPVRAYMNLISLANELRRRGEMPKLLEERIQKLRVQLFPEERNYMKITDFMTLSHK